MNDAVSKSFEELVELKYQLYNGLFLTLPLDAVEQTGLLIPLLEEAGSRGLEDGADPIDIISGFFTTHKPDFSESDQINFLFKVIQYVERQVVLVDAIEDAAYSDIHQTEETNILGRLIENTKTEGGALEQKLAGILNKFSTRVTLTAHPTQFYPGQVLAIITDLTKAVSQNNIVEARSLLQQLGNTPFFKKQKPSPYDEAVLLAWYLGNIFYPSISTILDRLAAYFPQQTINNNQLISIGFWPGGDRDGNPFVSADTTRQVAAKLRSLLVSCYHQDIRELKRRLSFEDVYEILDAIEKKLYQELSQNDPGETLTGNELLTQLNRIESIVIEKHQGLYIDSLHSFRRRVNNFGFHFASLDIRQDSRVIARSLASVQEKQPGNFPDQFAQWSEQQQIEYLLAAEGDIDLTKYDDPLYRDTLESLKAMQEIQLANGELACHRYIISNCRGPLDVARVIALFRFCGWSKLTVDIVPLFETVDDLRQAGDSMRWLYENSVYREHLRQRNSKQTVMVGFSDGTKDGGYLMANWAIYQAKEDVTASSRQHGIEVAFFDGRGGPPARGGGSTYKFYAALGKKIESNQIELTVQGQTVSSHYGTQQAALHNLRQLLAAGLENNLYDRPERELDDSQRKLMQNLADISYAQYVEFKNHPLFLPYLQEMSTLKYYGMANIGSRPSKRGSEEELRFEDLRAIPFVGAWSQLKQNVPGFYGLGTALKALEDEGKLQQCTELYQQSKFFRALIDNSMQSMCKTNFQLTAYMAKDEKFGQFWQMIYDEYTLSRAMALKISSQSVLLEDNSNSRLRIQLRERIVLPLLIIQQYALIKIHELPDQDEALTEKYEKMVIRSLFGNINASRNSA